MRIKDYLDEILNIIAKHPFVVSQSISFEERPPDIAFITDSITFTNGSKLHFKEFVVFETAGFKILKYGYNYLAQDGAVIFRYDNALDPQTKRLSTYPEHKHTSNSLLKNSTNSDYTDKRLDYTDCNTLKYLCNHFFSSVFIKEVQHEKDYYGSLYDCIIPVFNHSC